jgi:hypothetical protein
MRSQLLAAAGVLIFLRPKASIAGAKRTSRHKIGGIRLAPRRGWR